MVFAGLLLQTLSLVCALGLLAVAYASAGRADRRRYGSYATAAAEGQGSAAAPLSARLKTFLAVLPLAGACVLARCAYRAASAWGGLGSPVARDGVAWLVAEGVLLTEAMVTLAVFHPGVWLDDQRGRQQQRQRQQYDVEGAGHGLLPSSEAPGMMMTISPAAAKRLSSGTTLSTDDLEEEKNRLRGRRMRDVETAEDAAAGQGFMVATPNLMAPSEAGSFSEAGSPTRRRAARGSVVLDIDPYYQFEDSSPYDPHLAAVSPPSSSSSSSSPPAPVGRRYYSEDAEEEEAEEYITAETRGLSPMEAEAEQARLEAASFMTAPEPPRKSSKRASRVLEHHSIGREEGDDDDDDEQHDSFDVESFVEPPRKSSKRVSRVLVDNAAGPSALPPLRKPSRKGTLRVPGGSRDDQEEDDDDRMEVESIVLPPRKPSKRETVHGAEEDLDAVSLYSQ